MEVIDKTLICTAQGYPKPEIIWFVQYWRSPKKGQLQNFFGCSQIGFSETNVDAVNILKLFYISKITF